MAKVKKAFFCRNCGFEAPKWLGRCPSCGEWNTFTEEVIARESGGGPATVANLPKARPQRIADIHESEHRRIDLGNRDHPVRVRGVVRLRSARMKDGRRAIRWADG